MNARRALHLTAQCVPGSHPTTGRYRDAFPLPLSTSGVTSGKSLPSGLQRLQGFHRPGETQLPGQGPISSLTMLGRPPNFSGSRFPPLGNMHKPQWGGHITSALVLASRGSPGRCPIVAGPGAVAGGRTGVPAMWLLTSLHLHCGQRRKRRERGRHQGLTEPELTKPSHPQGCAPICGASEDSRARDPEFPSAKGGSQGSAHVSPTLMVAGHRAQGSATAAGTGEEKQAQPRPMRGGGGRRFEPGRLALEPKNWSVSLRSAAGRWHLAQHLWNLLQACSLCSLSQRLSPKAPRAWPFMPHAGL